MAAWVFAANSRQMTILVAARDLGPGHVVSASDLRAVEVGRAGGLRAVQPGQQDLLVGRAALGPIPEGRCSTSVSSAAQTRSSLPVEWWSECHWSRGRRRRRRWRPATGSTSSV